MSALLLERLHGVVPPVTTPLTDDGRFDRASAEKLYQHMLDAGVHGLFIFGSSGEGPVLSAPMRTETLQTAIKTVRARIPVLVGVMAPGTDGVIAQAKVAEDAGADAVVVSPPFYYPVNQTELYEHFRLVREAVKIPVIAYDIPVTVKVKIQAATMLRMADDGLIVGMKDSSGDTVGFRRILAKRPKGFKMFTGSELQFDAALLQGADGIVPGLANVGPELFVRVFEHWRAGRREEALQAQQDVVRLFETFVQSDGGIYNGHLMAVMKYAQKTRGWIATDKLCAPFKPLAAEDQERVRRIMIETGLLKA